ncbi:MAG: hypothetical protein Q7V01_00995 [Vicinamibacterales bacterium]|nr:hypothetical protein [Vicinamibacterales bacterium]
MSNRLGRLALMGVAWTGLGLCTLMGTWTGWLLVRTVAYSTFGREAVAVVRVSDCAGVARAPGSTGAGQVLRCPKTYRYRVPDARGGGEERTGSFEGLTPPFEAQRSDEHRLAIRYLSFWDSWSRPADAVAADAGRWFTVAMLFIPSLFGVAMSRILLQLVRTNFPRGT